MFDLFSLIIFFVLVLVGWIIYKIYIWPIYITPLRKIPGLPSENPFFGHLKAIFDKENINIEWTKKYGPIVKYHGLLNEPTILISDVEIIQKITSDQSYDFIKPPHLFGGIKAYNGNGLPFVEGDDHKRQRKMMNPVFSHNNIKEMVPTFVRVALTLKTLLENEVNSGESKINLSPYISKATLDVIGSVGFSYEFNSLTSSSELADAYGVISNCLNSHIQIFMNLLSYYIPFIRKIPIDLNKRFNDACVVIDRVSRQLVKERKEEAKNGELKGKDLLSYLINFNNQLPNEEKMTDEELATQNMTILFAGHETTSSAICWALYFLSHHPHVQDLLREELVKTFPDKSKFNPTHDEINSLEYLNCVVKEILRLRPSVLTTFRYNLEDEVLGDYFIPKGTTIAIGISIIHQQPSIWGPTADEFDPKRWMDPSLISNLSNLNYLPFLNGVRSCIGNKIALNEFKTLLSMLVRNFIFQPIEGFHIKNQFFLALSKPLPYLYLTVSKVES